MASILGIKTHIKKTISFLGELKTLLTTAKNNGLILESEFKFMFNSSLTIATIYALPKVHKATRPFPGRPIISGCNRLTQGASIYLDQILRPFVVTLPSFLQDTKDTVSKLREVRFTDNPFLPILDVESLCTNI